MKISLIYPIYQEEQRLAQSLLDIISFFQKLPLQTEVILVLDPSQDRTAEIAQNKIQEINRSQSQTQFHILKNKTRVGRGQSIQKGLLSATGDILFCGAIDLNIPLAEYYNTLSDFVMHPDTQFVVGNRFDLKKPRHGLKNKVAQFFEAIEHEKLKKSGFSVQDPTCQFLAVRKDAFDKMKPSFHKVNKWFYSANLLSLAYNNNIPISEKSIICHDNSETRFQWWMSFF